MLIISWIDHNWSMCQSVSMSCKENDMKMTWNSHRTSDFLTSIVLPRATWHCEVQLHRAEPQATPQVFDVSTPQMAPRQCQGAKAGLAWPRRCDVLNWYDHFTYTITIYILSYYTLIMITCKNKYSIQYTSHWITCKLIKAHCKHIVSSCTAFCDILQQSID